MIIVIAEATARPDRLETVFAQLVIAAAASRNDPGCISYGFYSDLTDPGKVVAVERWESRELLDAHLQTEHVRALSAVLADSLAAPAVINVYEVSSRGGFD